MRARGVWITYKLRAEPCYGIVVSMKKKPINIRISAEAYKALKAIAKKEKRTLTATIDLLAGIK